MVKKDDEDKARLRRQALERLKAKQEQYWRDRAQSHVFEVDRTVKSISRDIRKAHKRALKLIVKDLNKYKTEIIPGDSLERKNLRQRLSFRDKASFMKEANRKRQTIINAIKETNDPKLKKHLSRYLDISDRAGRINTLTVSQAIQKQLQLDIAKLALQEQQLFEKGAKKIQKVSSARANSELDKVTRRQVNNDLSLNSIKAAEEKWLGRDFSDRIWENKGKLLSELRRVIIQGTVSNKGADAMAKELSHAMDVADYAARRIVRTEYNLISNQASLEAYKSRGITKYKFIAAIDSVTSSLCTNLNGQEFSVNEAKVGVNFPPMHPNCRSITSPVLDGEEYENKRFDLSNVELTDEELAEIGATRAEYEAVMGKGRGKYSLTDKEATEARRGALTKDERKTEKLKIEADTKELKVELDKLNFELKYELKWLEDTKHIAPTKGTVEMQAKRANSLAIKTIEANKRLEDVVERQRSVKTKQITTRKKQTSFTDRLSKQIISINKGIKEVFQKLKDSFVNVAGSVRKFITKHRSLITNVLSYTTTILLYKYKIIDPELLSMAITQGIMGVNDVTLAIKYRERNTQQLIERKNLKGKKLSLKFQSFIKEREEEESKLIEEWKNNNPKRAKAYTENSKNQIIAATRHGNSAVILDIDGLEHILSEHSLQMENIFGHRDNIINGLLCVLHYNEEWKDGKGDSRQRVYKKSTDTSVRKLYKVPDDITPWNEDFIIAISIDNNGRISGANEYKERE